MKEHKPRGFAAMTPEQRRTIAGLGGRAAHAKGAGREWTPDEARIAGVKGGARARPLAAVATTRRATREALEAQAQREGAWVMATRPRLTQRVGVMTGEMRDQIIAAVACPNRACGAKVGEPCRGRPTIPHARRYDAWKRHEKGGA